MIKKREAKELKIINMRNERYGITRDSSDVKIIIILYDQLYDKKFDNLYKMNIFITRYKFPKLT